MAIRIHKPTTPGRRNSSVNLRTEVTQNRPEKSLLQTLVSRGGRNNQGKITSRFRGGGNKRAYRIIDFKRRQDDQPAKVLSIEYDPNRSAYIALIEYATGQKAYILAPSGLSIGQTVQSSSHQIELQIGNCMPLSEIPVGIEVHNIEMQPGRGGQLARAAGTYATVKSKVNEYVQLDLPSGESRLVHKKCRATIGQLGNPDHQNARIGKAGRMRHLGRRPHNRGTSMNPCDHPMGGGEGRAHGGRHPCSPTGKLSKGGKTRKRKRSSNRLIIRRRKSVRYGQLIL